MDTRGNGLTELQLPDFGNRNWKIMIKFVSRMAEIDGNIIIDWQSFYKLESPLNLMKRWKMKLKFIIDDRESEDSFLI